MTCASTRMKQRLLHRQRFPFYFSKRAGNDRPAMTLRAIHGFRACPLPWEDSFTSHSRHGHRWPTLTSSRYQVDIIDNVVIAPKYSPYLETLQWRMGICTATALSRWFGRSHEIDDAALLTRFHSNLGGNPCA
ncbi:hypothetical protein DYST_02356 [Dyella terrae]|nr:hypothetical protein DYST_02356 [Dyella terrae]